MSVLNSAKPTGRASQRADAGFLFPVPPGRSPTFMSDITLTMNSLIYKARDCARCGVQKRRQV